MVGALIRPALMIIIAALVLAPGKPLMAQEIELDDEFQENGTLLLDFGEDESARAMVVLPNGDIVLAGSTGLFNVDEEFLLVRVDADGDLDETFGDSGVDGLVLTDFDGFDDRAHALIRQQDGKLIAAGRAFIDNVDFDFALARYNADGTLDLSFGTNGVLVTDFDGENDEAHDIALQEDGKIVAAGTAVIDLDTDFALARYNSDGTLDTSFGGDGLVTTDFLTNDDGAMAVVIQEDGKILAAGFTFNGTNNDFALARYNADGTLDASFGTDGLVVTDFDGEPDIAYDLALQDNGRILAAGSAVVDLDQDFALARYEQDGDLDPTFQGDEDLDFGDPAADLADGLVVTDFDGEDDIAFRLAIQEDGKILAAGSAVIDVDSDFALARYNQNGSLDETFQRDEGVIFNGTDPALEDGLVVTDLDGEDDQARDLALLEGDRILLAGTAFVDTSNDLALVRYTGDEDDDGTTFTASGGCVASPSGPSGGWEWLFLLLLLVACRRVRS